MGLPDGFGNPEPATLQDDFAADRKIDPVSRRHKNGPDPGSCPQTETDFLLGMILEIRERPSLSRRRAEGKKGCLGATDGRNIQDHSGVGG
jgi:hypothetical protein